MDCWYFGENPYPNLPDDSEYESIRVSLPNRHFDPAIGAELYNRYLDEWQAADELGLYVMANEHHQTATCMQPAVPVIAGILARITKNARILILGNPVANRPDPIRVAEEMALIDNISRGRLDVGFVRSVPYEALPANSNPVGLSDRMWEATDLILRAWTEHDGPFNYEGSWHYRQVNIWPRPYQQPHPPVWITALSPSSIAPIARRNYVVANFLTGFDKTKALYDGYRKVRLDEGLEPAEVDRFAYAALVYVGDSDEEAWARAEELRWYFDSNKVPMHFSLPPGYAPPRAVAQALKAGLKGDGPIGTNSNPKGKSIEWLIENGLMFAGSPETVTKQIERFYEHVGGFGHLLIMGQAGYMTHKDTVRSLELFATEVKPRLDELKVASLTGAG